MIRTHALRIPVSQTLYQLSETGTGRVVMQTLCNQGEVGVGVSGSGREAEVVVAKGPTGNRGKLAMNGRTGE